MSENVGNRTFMIKLMMLSKIRVEKIVGNVVGKYRLDNRHKRTDPLIEF